MNVSLNTWLAIATVVLAATSVYLGVRLAQERGRTGADTQEVSTLREQLERTQESERQLQSDLSVERARARNAELAESPPRPATAAGSALPGAAQGVLTKSLGPIARPALAPKHRVAMARMQYGKMLRELDLSEAQTDEVLRTFGELAENATSPASLLLEVGGPGAASEQARARLRAELEAAIGGDKTDRLEGLVKTMPTRTQISSARMQLEMLGEPLTETQHSELLALLSARGPQPSAPKLAGPEGLEAFRKWSQEQHTRFLDDAKPVLTPRQITRLAENYEMTGAMMAQGAQLRSGAAGSAAP
jgi:hypothetical protein